MRIVGFFGGWEVGAMTVEEVSFALVCPRAEAEAGVTFWVEQGVVLCASETPRQFRRVKFFGEKGLEMGGERDDGGVLEAMRPFERFVVDILNVCYDFDVAKLQRRLTVFLQGANRCRDGDGGVRKTIAARRICVCCCEIWRDEMWCMRRREFSSCVSTLVDKECSMSKGSLLYEYIIHVNKSKGLLVIMSLVSSKHCYNENRNSLKREKKPHTVHDVVVQLLQNRVG